MTITSTPARRTTLWDRLIAIAEARPEVRAINQLNAISDAELAARGLTRQGEVHRIIGARFYI